MNADDEFDRAEARSEVSRIDGAAFDHVLTDFLAERTQLLHAEVFDISRRIDAVKKRMCRIAHCRVQSLSLRRY